MSHYDNIIVGAGSAGCTLAHRLIEQGRKVLLLEEGAKDNHPFIHIPATFVRVIGSHRTFLYKTLNSPDLADRPTYIPQGRTLGGGSSVNAMIYIRGQQQGYDEWRDLHGCTGWGWEDVLPYFKKSEANEVLAGPLHGTDGPLRVSHPRFRHPLSRAFVKAGQQAGLSYNEDFNGDDQQGVGFYQTTTFNGQRGSTAARYLKPVRNHPNLSIKTGARVTRLLLDGKKVTGVEWCEPNGKLHSAQAQDDVILCAGALATPKILMLSGLGPREQLQKAGVEVIADLPAVGQNYHDHLEVPVYARLKAPLSVFGQDKGIKAIKNGLHYLLYRSGLLSSTIVESGAFIDSTGSGRADIQFHVLPTFVGDVDRDPLDGHGITLNPGYLKPYSRGEVRLTSSNPAKPLEIDSGYLSDPRDLDTLVRGVKLARDILAQPALADLVSSEEKPGPECQSEEALKAYVRSHCKTVYHPAGTCRMGEDDRSVVDPELKVRDIGNLRICDASIMPELPSGNTNAPTIMIAERCADFIARDANE